MSRNSYDWLGTTGSLSLDSPLNLNSKLAPPQDVPRGFTHPTLATIIHNVNSPSFQSMLCWEDVPAGSPYELFDFVGAF
nr:hypothetical protein CFP56_70456 [Quercus suber]